MNPADKQIVAAYAAGLTSEQIASSYDYETEAVNYCLATHSPEYRADNKQLVKQGEQPLFGSSDLDAAKQVIKDLMISSEVDAVRARMAVFVVNEAKGRNDLQALKGTNIDITIINERISNAKAARTRALNLATPSVNMIDVPTTAVQQA